MPGQRIRGQETFISIISDGELQDRIDSVTEAEFTHNLDTQEDNFLGEGAPRFDMIFKGTSFRVAGQLTNRRFFDFQKAIINKAQRRVGGAVRIDITTTFIFPDGDIFTIGFEDCSFSSIPVTTGSREDFVTWTLEGSVSQGTEVPV